MSIESIELWHKRARPNPNARNLDVQVACHLEEIAEMFEVLRLTDRYGTDLSRTVWDQLHLLSQSLKEGLLKAEINERGPFLDALADQVVTAVGVGHCADMRVSEAVRRVNASNWTKYDEDGLPLFSENGKIQKGPRYTPPDLEGLY
ncbi:MAG: hypothetical protein ACKO0Z_19510 [Betaproteobacteria bacterium]